MRAYELDYVVHEVFSHSNTFGCDPGIKEAVSNEAVAAIWAVVSLLVPTRVVLDDLRNLGVTCCLKVVWEEVPWEGISEVEANGDTCFGGNRTVSLWEPDVPL